MHVHVNSMSEFLAELTKANKDLEAMRKQAQSTNREYDRLLEEHAKLQVRVAKKLLNHRKLCV